MKTKTVQTASPFKKNLIWLIILLGSFTLSSYKSLACTANFTVTAGVNGHYTFTDASTGVRPLIWYSWNAGDGSGWQSGNDKIFIHTYTANNTYNVKLAIYDTVGVCGDTITIPVTVTNVTTPCTLSANFTYTVAPHGVVNFTSASTGINANTLYYWSPGDSNQTVQDSNLFTHTYLYNGYYGVWLKVLDTGNAYCIDSVFRNIYVSTSDSCNLHADFTYTVGATGQVTFTNTSTGTGGDSLTYYLWDMGDNTGNFFSYSPAPFTYTYSHNGTYYVTLKDTSFCSDTITIPVTITNACNMTVNFTHQYDSSGQVQFTSASTGVNDSTQYTWSFGDSTTASGYDTVTHDYSFIGYYNVTLTVADSGGCMLSSTKSIYIYNKDSLKAGFIYYPDSISPGVYDFTSTSLGTNANTYYKWTPGDGSPSDSGLGMSTYQHTYLTNGPYSASLTIWYTVLPHSPIRSAPRYDLSTYTTTVNITTAVTGIPSIGGDSQIYTIYPNPNNGSFWIAVNGLTSEKNAEIRISNMMGQVIYQSNAAVNGGNTLSNINLQNAANGIYLLQIITPGNTSTYRIAIQR